MGRLLLPAVSPGAAKGWVIFVEVAVGAESSWQAPVGIDLGVASRHSVQMLEADGQLVCRSSCVPTVQSVTVVERAALAARPSGAAASCSKTAET